MSQFMYGWMVFSSFESLWFRFWDGLWCLYYVLLLLNTKNFTIWRSWHSSVYHVKRHHFRHGLRHEKKTQLIIQTADLGGIPSINGPQRWLPLFTPMLVSMSYCRLSMFKSPIIFDAFSVFRIFMSLFFFQAICSYLSNSNVGGS